MSVPSHTSVCDVVHSSTYTAEREVIEGPRQEREKRGRGRPRGSRIQLRERRARETAQMQQTLAGFAVRREPRRHGSGRSERQQRAVTE